MPHAFPTIRRVTLACNTSRLPPWPHIHFDIDGYGAKWACGIPDQNILKPQSDDFASLFWSFQETCNITDNLKVELSLGV